MRSRSAAEYADVVLPLLGGGGRVIDVGCGPGLDHYRPGAGCRACDRCRSDEGEFTDDRYSLPLQRNRANLP